MFNNHEQMKVTGIEKEALETMTEYVYLDHNI